MLLALHYILCFAIGWYFLDVLKILKTPGGFWKWKINQFATLCAWIFITVLVVAGWLK
jgi:hypothetical protein